MDNCNVQFTWSSLLEDSAASLQPPALESSHVGGWVGRTSKTWATSIPQSYNQPRQPRGTQSTSALI